jgi:hypothetical protein
MIHAMNSWERRITCVVHPESDGVVESERFGGIRTERGPAGYVLQDGTKVTL